MEINIKAPAKINLYLNILNKLDNGYHNVDMIMQSVSLYDDITVCTTGTGAIEVTSNFNFAGDVKKNTAYIAATEFFEYTKIENTGIKINIEKNIPVCAGLAGGSADAAGVLVALNELFNAKLSKCDLAKIGRNVGADVPFCIFGGTMLATGTGTDLKSLPHIPDCYIVLVKPNIFISTKTAYAKVDETQNTADRTMHSIIYAINNKNLYSMAKQMYNRFEQVLRIKEVYKIKNMLFANGAVKSSMSGSGPSVFGVFSNEKKAMDCINMLKTKYKDVFLCTPTKQGCIILKNKN